jgi:glycosyltransferase involved in cell wall biosynthesis
MNIFFIRIGKAFRVLTDEGFVRGGKRIIRTFFLLFRRVKSGNVLFITGGVGDSARYRTKHVAEELSLQGLSSSITVQDNPFLLSYAEKFSVFVFHRVLYTPRVARLIDTLKTLKKEIIFDTDDLVYDPAFLKHMDYFAQMNTFERKLYAHGVGGEILSDPYIKVCTTSTAFLAEKLREKGKKVFVVHNKLSQEDRKVSDDILRITKKDSALVKISYLSGTPSHNKDFAVITDVLLSLLEKYPHVRLVLAGPLEIEDKLAFFKDQIERITFLPRKEYFATVASMDINLAPLEIGNPFCEAKSELKWFEAGLMAVPTVASATGTFREAIVDGVDGYVAESKDEWMIKLARLIEDEIFRKKMGEQAREKIVQLYTTSSVRDVEYSNYLREKTV